MNNRLFGSDYYFVDPPLNSSHKAYFRFDLKKTKRKYKSTEKWPCRNVEGLNIPFFMLTSRTEKSGYCVRLSPCSFQCFMHVCEREASKTFKCGRKTLIHSNKKLS